MWIFFFNPKIWCITSSPKHLRITNVLTVSLMKKHALSSMKALARALLFWHIWINQFAKSEYLSKLLPANWFPRRIWSGFQISSFLVMQLNDDADQVHSTMHSLLHWAHVPIAVSSCLAAAHMCRWTFWTVYLSLVSSSRKKY